MRQLADDIFAKITRLCKSGQNYEENQLFDRALGEYLAALELIPEPITDWEASTWILTAIGDMYFLLKDYHQSQSVLQKAILCPQAIGNPFIHLRLGQAQYELENFERAKDELARAFIVGGEEIFEEEDPKYLRWIQQFLRSSEN